MVKFFISQETLRDDFGVKKATIFLFKDVKRSVMNGAKTFFDSLYLNNCFLWNSWPLKIRLLQCYVMLWIHNIDAICTYLPSSFLKRGVKSLLIDGFSSLIELLVFK